MAFRTIQRVYLQNLDLFGPMKTELRGKEVREFSIMLHGKIGWWAWQSQYKCIHGVKKSFPLINKNNAY